MSEEKEIKTVEIPSRREHNGFHAVTLRVYWICPVCGKRRGEVSRVISWDGSRRLGCDGWDNPCGHEDYYINVRKEAAENGLNEGYRFLGN